jgi:hypothetical protein
MISLQLEFLESAWFLQMKLESCGTEMESDVCQVVLTVADGLMIEVGQQ